MKSKGLNDNSETAMRATEPGTPFLKNISFTKIGIKAIDEAHERFILTLAEKNKNSFKVFTRAEVAEHNTPEDFWVVIDDVVYNLTKYVNFHPGGDVFLLYAGKDATDEFYAFHDNNVLENIARTYAIGCVSEPETREEVLEFRRARHEVHSTYVTSERKRTAYHYGYYIFKVLLSITLSVSGFYLALTATWTEGSGAWPVLLAVLQTLMGAMLFGTGTQQGAFVGHDCLHNEVMQTRRGNHWLGVFVGNFLIGISASWWKWSHNIHHLSTNSVDHDLDITHMPLFAVNHKMVKGKFATKFAKWLASKQHWTFIPIILFSRFNLHAQSYIHILSKKRRVELRVWEVIALTLHFVMIGSVIAMMQSNLLRFVFVLFSYLLKGSLGFQLTVSHWALPTYEGMHSSTFVRNQIESSQNIITYFWNDWYYGGLNFQIEHHLFPRVPRYFLKSVKHDVIEPFCKKLSLVYHDSYFWAALSHLLKHLACEAQTIADMQLEGKAKDD